MRKSAWPTSPLREETEPVSPKARNSCWITYHPSYVLSLISLGREKETITKTKSNTLTTPAPQHPQQASYPHPLVDQTNKHNTTSSAKISTNASDIYNPTQKTRNQKSGGCKLTTSKITLTIKLQLGHTAISSPSRRSAIAISNRSPHGHG